MSNKILIVEDEKTLLNILADELSKNGFEVLKANNGEEGLESALKSHPDLILLDILMPVMNGIKVLEELNKDSWGKDAKVILLTNLSEPVRETSTMDLSKIDYIVKSDMALSAVVEVVKSKLQKESFKIYN